MALESRSPHLKPCVTGRPCKDARRLSKYVGPGNEAKRNNSPNAGETERFQGHSCRIRMLRFHFLVIVFVISSLWGVKTGACYICGVLYN